MNEGTNVKQQIVERIKNSTNILVTVSTDPSVDELSAALGLTLLLNKLNKHATAVVSGELPPAITFLDPQKTFENSVDSLRDFIIALDKEKADHLRYKVEGDVVKIFITPYRTTISNEDLDFSQGDYNVELVIALGVKNKDHLDTALTAHGRILHDAAVATLTAGDETSELGSLSWHDDNASSLSEMLVSLSEALKTDKVALDEPTATAFLTGIVAATDRFSNNRTSSRVMTMAAQLMAAGANQQLIAAKLQEAHEIGPKDDGATTPPTSDDGTTNLEEGQSTKLDKTVPEAKKPTPKKKDDGSLSISHEKSGDIEAVGAEVIAENQEEAARVAEDQLAEQLEATKAATPADLPSVAELQQDIASATDEVTQAAEAEPLSGAVSNWQPQSTEPQLGGTLNATTEQAADDRRREEQDDRNRTILTHDTGEYVGDSQPTFQSPLNAAAKGDDEPASVDPFAEAVAPSTQATAHAAPLEPVTIQQDTSTPAQAPTLADIDEQNRAQHDEARAAVEAALNNPPAAEISQPAPQPSFEAQPAPVLPSMPPMPDFSTLPPLPPLPDLSTMQGPSGAVPADKLGDIFGSNTPEAPQQPPEANPGQFRIPGQ
jgi:hypothetical protein